MDDLELTISSDNEIDEAIKKLSGDEMNKIIKRATSSAASIVLKRAKENLRGVTNRSKSRYTNLKRGWNAIVKRGKVIGVRTLEQGIRQKYHAAGKNEDDAGFTKVNIMGDFRLNFFEGGTKERKKKSNNASTGHMTATNFFTKAISETESDVYSRMSTIIEANLKNIWDN